MVNEPWAVCKVSGMAPDVPGQFGVKGHDLRAGHHGVLGVAAVKGAAHAAHQGRDLLSRPQHAVRIGVDDADRLAPLGLRLAPDKTRVVHVDEGGFDFLGHHIRRLRKRGTSKYYVYTKPSKKAVQTVRDKVSAKTHRSTRNQDPAELILSLNRMLRGWANYFRHGVSKAIFNAIDAFTWGAVDAL
ncbi:group II intron maturase-specific domain-containing protein, partial [Nonomuraea sp. NPDC059194]|uniref:group II intron maturase-specific domain-containing protein n=1 Tax=Nonomuraea sp. NPDC059194 TaxID=3346764 RepID=UPI00369EC0B4